MNKRSTVLIAALLLVSMPLDVHSQQIEVLRVIDGDTLIGKIGKKIEHIRVVGIDTPELHDKKTGVAQCYSREARNETRKILSMRIVALERDHVTSNRDSYGRLLRSVKSGSIALDEHLVANGFARVYTRSPATKLELLKKIERQAQNSKNGLWGACK